MKNKLMYTMLVTTIIFGAYVPVSKAYAEAGHEHEEEHEEDGDQANLTDKAIENSGIQLMEAGNGTIHQTISLTGRITLNQNKTASVKARFPGIVKSVTKTQGEAVKLGDVLATVESNESLQVYAVKSPLDGIILSRTTNMGDVAGDAPMFTIADMDELWVEFHVFSQDSDHIKSGSSVTISSSECEKTQDTTIQSLLPITEASSQTLLARATIKNLDSHWLPGMSVRGDVVIDSLDVSLAVKTSALQQMEGQTVVFVKEGESFKMRPVKIAASDKTWTEITDGLKTGETYVSEGSFIIKAEIGKASAEHAH
jgi:cobalt-zinc-cadmium efflux system membrane fusion protein